MKRNQTASSSDSQYGASLQLRERISMTVQRRFAIPKPLIRILVAFVGLYASVMTLYGFYRFPMDVRTVRFACIAFILFFGVIYHLPRRLHLLAQVSLIGLEVVIYRNWEAFLAGYRAVYRTFRERILTERALEDVKAITATARWSEAQCTTFFLCCILFVLAMAIVYFVTVHPNFIVSFLLTFPFLECGLLFGYRTDSMAVFGQLGFWMAMLAMQCAKVGKREVSKDGLIRVGIRPIAAESAALLMLLLSLLGSGLIIRRTENYVRTEAIDAKRTELRATFSNMSMMSLADILNRIPLPFESSLLVDEIDLSSRGNLTFDGKDALVVEVDGEIPKEDYYLRGICRGTYTGSGWDISKKELRAQKDLFSKLEDNQTLPQSFEFYAEETASELTMQIEAMQSESVNYLPYASLYNHPDTTPIQRVIYDSEIRLKDRKKYQVALDNEGLYRDILSFPDVPLVFQQIRSPLPEQAAYEEFAIEHYTQLGTLSPELEALKEDFLRTLDPGTFSYTALLYQIQYYIWERADYTLDPGDTPKGKDLAAYFLTENHAGYCAHYATSAVLLCRMAGIPARYCQGYVISKTDFNPSNYDKKTDRYRIPIPNYRAHAWAEIFVPMYGWIPFEFTEGVEALWYSESSRQDILESLTAMTSTTTTLTTTQSSLSTTTTTTTTTTASVSDVTKPTTTEDGKAPLSKRPLLTAKQVLTIGGILLGIAGVWILLTLLRRNHERIVRKRKYAMTSPKTNEAANASYLFLMTLLRLQGIVQGNRTHEAFAEYAQQTSGLLPEGAMETILTVQQAIAFGNHTVSEEDAARVAALVFDYAQKLYDNSTKREQFKLRWLYHIVA